jgi:hypothetical protein
MNQVDQEIKGQDCLKFRDQVQDYLSIQLI